MEKNLCLLLLHYVTNPEPVIESYKLNTFSEVSIFAWLFYITDYSNTPLESWKEIQHKQKLVKNLTKSVTNITFIFHFLCHIEEMKVEMLNVCRSRAKIWWHNWLYEIYNDLLIFHRSHQMYNILLTLTYLDCICQLMNIHIVVMYP